MSEHKQLTELAQYLNNAPESAPDDLIRSLWNSTNSLHDRFGVQPSVQVQITMILEETTEVIRAALFETKQDAAQEIADCIVVALGMAMALDISLDEVMAGIRAVIDKNDRKSDATHYLNTITGKITRRTV